MTELQALQDRVAELESRLEIYHARLEACLDHDRQFQLKATWGIVNVTTGVICYLAASYVLQKWFHLGEWSVSVAVVAYLAAAMWSDAGRDKDLEKLSRLPEWPAT